MRKKTRRFATSLLPVAGAAIGMVIGTGLAWVTTVEVVADSTLPPEPPAEHRSLVAAAVGDGARLAVPQEIADGAVTAINREVYTEPPGQPGVVVLCTAGFGATDPSGRPVVVTAGHCAVDPSASPTGGPWTRVVDTAKPSMSDPHPMDYGMYPAGLPWRARMGYSTASDPENPGSAPVVEVTGTAAPVPGMPVCVFGRSSGWRCGSVTRVEEDGTSFWANVPSWGGDSGGAAFTGDRVVGIASVVSQGGPRTAMDVLTGRGLPETRFTRADAIVDRERLTFGGGR